ncbi:transcriptional regulator prz1 [Moniliophthora roreri MCA 2997]|uniref:Transcriptional regulator prz1 n=2 Tax=Moniliophthora roreri TaxID=221103 RepID=V2XS42_MONRO|nr:transcriptional regulator prz1 [Moniliophthora roreri MCA 2997]KAI3618750.1 transcriptional regulator prz1 [Moniliophthora roreri]
MSIQAINDTGFAILPQAGPQNSSFPPQLLPSPNAMRPAPGPADPHHLPPPPLQIPVDQLRMGSPLSASGPPPNGPPFSTTAQPVDAMSLSANYYPSANASTRLPPILQVEKQQVTTSATQLASASRRRNEAQFTCPVPGCGSTFTRRFNLRGHLRSHTEERPFVCDWPGCKKGFARQHDCKRHQALHTAKPQSNVCQGCKKTFSRLDALNRHLRSDGGAECREKHEAESKVKADPGAVTIQLPAGNNDSTSS